MGHDHVHCHAHGHSHGNFDRAFAIGMVLNIIYVVVEAGAGFWLGSLALLADAGHNLSDVLGLAIAWGGHYLARWQPTVHRTYGWRSSSILAALANALLLLVAVGGIVWEAAHRLFDPVLVAGEPVMAVAAVGVVINVVTAAMFHRGRAHDVNIRGAYLHMAADAAVSVGVVIAGGVMLWTAQAWVDPVISLLIAVVILIGTWGLFRESLNLVMHGVPAGIDPVEVRTFLEQQAGVVEVHDLHIWAMSTTETALTAHLVMPDGGDHDPFLDQTAHRLHEQFGIAHATLQIERGSSDAPCRLAPDHVV